MTGTATMRLSSSSALLSRESTTSQRPGFGHSMNMPMSSSSSRTIGLNSFAILLDGVIVLDVLSMDKP